MTHNLELDLRFDGGRIRIKRTTGSTDRRRRTDMKAMLRWLWRQPEYRHLVGEVGEGARDLQDLYGAYLRGALTELAPLIDDKPLYDAREAWLTSFDCSPSHRQRLKQTFRHLEGLRRRPARITEIPVLLLEYRQSCVTGNSPRAFNYARAGAQAMLRDLVGRRHPLYQRVADLRPMREAKQGRKGLTVPEALAVRQALPPTAARIWWSMCWTGMGPTEFWAEWSVLADRVRIRGTKRPGRRWGTEGRDVPLVVTPLRAEVTLGRFTKVLRAAGAAPRQARNTFGRALEDAGIPRTRRKLYLGHSAGDVTDLYERHEITTFLADDAGRLRELLGAVGGALEAVP